MIFSLLKFSKGFNLSLVRTSAQIFRAGLLKVRCRVTEKELIKLPQQRSGFSLLELKTEVRQSSYGDLRAGGITTQDLAQIIHINVQICEGSESLLFLQSSYLACHSFMDAGKDKKTPGSKTKDFIIHGSSTSELVPVH